MTSPKKPAGTESPKSYGNMSDQHWSRTRGERNREAIDYYRERSKAPGVKDGGAERNFYCMECDGVIAYEHEGERCPHCDAELAGIAKRYFNWVEIDSPPDSDFRALLPWLATGFAALLLLVGLALWAFL